jgi:hypothetical protein
MDAVGRPVVGLRPNCFTIVAIRGEESPKTFRRVVFKRQARRAAADSRSGAIGEKRQASVGFRFAQSL